VTLLEELDFLSVALWQHTDLVAFTSAFEEDGIGIRADLCCHDLFDDQLASKLECLFLAHSEATSLVELE